MKINGFYFITDSTLTKSSVIEDVKAAVKAGVKVVQYREKYKSAKEMVKEALEIKRICEGKCLFLINDRIDIAMAIDADGVHLGQDDIPCLYARKLLGRDKIIGITVHNTEAALTAERDGADYLGVSPIFATRTKKDAMPPLGVEIIREIKKVVNIPVVAVGGINLDNLTSVLEAGADGISAVSVVVSSDNVEKECRRFIKAISEFYKSKG
ncbi:MAG: thiamine phosphate synthase [Candidatus Omnitrophica bacterium]|nr:thiamine phosphate synthase [Candidatus Omnitrophota bacterium]